MISAKLIKDLEREGFRLEFPSYESNEERIMEILKENNSRLNLAMPLLLRYTFDYRNIVNRLNSMKTGAELIKNFKKIIVISSKIFKLEGIDNRYLKTIIKEGKIKEKIRKEEFEYYHDSFIEFIRKSAEEDESYLKEQIKIRGKLNTNKALSNIYSPGKLRIMDKIFNHEPLTNTELKYYYRSIRPLNLSIVNEDMQKYARIIESIRKIRIGQVI